MKKKTPTKTPTKEEFLRTRGLPEDLQVAIASAWIERFRILLLIYHHGRSSNSTRNYLRDFYYDLEISEVFYFSITFWDQEDLERDNFPDYACSMLDLHPFIKAYKLWLY